MASHTRIHHANFIPRKRWRGRLQSENRRHHSIIRSLKQNNGLYRVQFRQREKVQNDGGANICLTDNKTLLLNYKTITPKSVKGCSKEGSALKCEGVGYFPWYTSNGARLLIRTFYSPSADGTIFPPTDIQRQYKEKYVGWCFNANCDTGLGQMTLTGRDNTPDMIFDTYMENKLWYHYLHIPSASDMDELKKASHFVCNRLNNQASYELWHNRLGHPGSHIMDTIHKHADGVPKLQCNRFYHCATCLHSKFRRRARGKRKNARKKKDPGKEHSIKTRSELCTDSSFTSPSSPSLKPGQSLYMDFGFVRGTDWTSKDEEGRTVTSIDGERAYLLVIDEATRWIWVFPTVSKTPPIDLIRGVLQQFPNHPPGSTIRCDQGGELGRSQALAKLLLEEKHILQTTGAFSSSQNGLAEKPNQDLAQTIRCLLQGAGLGSEHWSYALRHAVYLKNRLPHAAIQTSPYEALNGHKPNLSHLRVFGSKVTVQTSERRAKLDTNNSAGLFMTLRGQIRTYVLLILSQVVKKFLLMPGLTKRTCLHRLLIFRPTPQRYKDLVTALSSIYPL